MGRQGIRGMVAVLPLFLLAGCSQLVLAAGRLGTADPSELRVGATRDEVEEALGKPIAAEPTPDGGLIQTYEYRVKSLGKAGIALTALSLYTLGLGEIVTLPLAIATVADWPRRHVRVTFGTDGRVVAIGQPTRPPQPPPPDPQFPEACGRGG